ncbi:hypothetical protein [Enterococcus faecalis]
MNIKAEIKNLIDDINNIEFLTKIKVLIERYEKTNQQEINK